MEEDITAESFLGCPFRVNKYPKLRYFYFHERELHMQPLQQTTAKTGVTTTLLYKRLLSVGPTITSNGRKICDKSAAYGFNLLHIVDKSNNKLEIKVITISHSDEEILTQLLSKLHEVIRSNRSRPRTLEVIVNPIGGKGKALEVYTSQVRPLLEIARVEHRVTVTQYASHAKDVAMTCDLTDVDGIICIGGDGTLSEITNGLIMRSHSNYNDAKAKVPDVHQVLLGIIPAGSTNSVAYCLHGTDDVRTAVLSILCGDSNTVDICSVHTEGRLLTYFMALSAYGYFGDLMKRSSTLRHLGPLRYEYAGIRTLFENASYKGTISFHKDSDSDLTKIKCEKECFHCSKYAIDTYPSEENSSSWISIRGDYFMINGANISCACSRSPNGLAPFCHLGDGYINLIVIRNIPFLLKLKLFLRLASKNNVINDLPFVDVYKTRQFKFEPGEWGSIDPTAKLSMWHCDGELLDNHSIFVQCHSRVIKMYYS